MSNMVQLHVHSDLSLCDSATKFKSYVDRAAELGQMAIASTEHGKPMQWVEKKTYCDSKGIKFIYGVECYLTATLDEKVRDNYHTVLLARNMDGIREINRAISAATQPDHFYYAPRLTFDEFLKLSKNVIALSGCTASPLNRLNRNDPVFEKLLSRYDYLEIQPHIAQDQRDYNIYLAALAKEHNKPLVATTDVHSLDQYKAECRDILIWDKHGSGYEDSDGYDLTYKSYDEMVHAFRVQNCLPENIWMQALENTNVIADSVSNFQIDRSLKYPILYGTRENDEAKFRELVYKKFEEKLETGVIPQSQKGAFDLALAEELRVFHKVGMEGFMLSEAETISWGKEQGYSVGPGRGSVCGSRVAYVTDITDVNPETWHTVFSRFCNEDRVEVGDIDVDVIESERPHFFEYVISRFGQAKTARVPTFGTLQNHAVIQCICRGLKNKLGEEGKKKYTQDYMKKIVADFDANPDAARKKYPDVLKYYDGLVDVKVSQSVHAAGIVISPITLADNYGVFEKDGDQVMMIDMDEIHDVGLVKYDFLILRNVAIIRDAYAMLGKPFPKSHEIDWDDQAVWKDMIKSPTGIFQMESPYAFSLLKKFEPRSIFDMSLVTAAVRPGGNSYRDELMQHIVHHNPSKVIDDLLDESLGYLVYQEQVISFLQSACGLSGSDADSVRRGIAKKKMDVLNKYLPMILDGYCSKSDKPRETAEREVNEFIQVIRDSSEYMFGKNHSIAYCLIGYICAYLRYYHPGEFIASLLKNAANMDDIAGATELAASLNIPIISPEFGLSRGEYSYDPVERVIVKGIGSIKSLNSKIGDDLYELAHKNHYDHFADVLFTINDQVKINAAQLRILIDLDYFRCFGNANELVVVDTVYEQIKDKKSIKRDAYPEGLLEVMLRSCKTLTAAGKPMVSPTIEDRLGMLRDVEDYVKTQNLPDYDVKRKMQIQRTYLGYIDCTGRAEDRRKLIVGEVKPSKRKSDGAVWAYMISTTSMGSGKTSQLTILKKIYDENPVFTDDIIYADCVQQNKKGFWNLLAYHKIA